MASACAACISESRSAGVESVLEGADFSVGSRDRLEAGFWVGSVGIFGRAGSDGGMEARGGTGVWYAGSSQPSATRTWLARWMAS